MKIPFVRVYVFWVSWWDVDHRVHGAPIEILVHTPRWHLGVRPFSNYAQGGDHRGVTDFHRHERVRKWSLSDQQPGIWERLTRSTDG